MRPTPFASRAITARIRTRGSSGGTRPGISPPALVLGSEAVYEDISGDVAARFPRVERVEPDARLLAAARGALPDALVLPIGTTARVGDGKSCRVEAMEGTLRVWSPPGAGTRLRAEIPCVSS